MKKHIQYRGAVVAAVVAAGVIGSGITVQAQTDTISLNWKEFAGAINDALPGYGVVSANNWQNLMQVTAGTDVTTSAGTTSTVDFSTTAPGGWGTYFNAALDNTPMRSGIESFNPGSGPDITLSDLSATFISYDVIVYVTGFNAATNSGAISDGSITKYFSVPNPYTGALIESTDINLGDGADAGTYVRFNGLSADSTIISLRQSSGGGVAIGGIQITGLLVPEPSSAAIALLGGGVLALLRRRSREP